MNYSIKILLTELKRLNNQLNIYNYWNIFYKQHNKKYASDINPEDIKNKISDIEKSLKCIDNCNTK